MIFKVINFFEKLSCPHNHRSTEFRALKVFEAVVQGKLSYKDYSRLGRKDLATVNTCLECGKQWYST